MDAFLLGILDALFYRQNHGKNVFTAAGKQLFGVFASLFAESCLCFEWWSSSSSSVQVWMMKS